MNRLRTWYYAALRRLAGNARGYIVTHTRGSRHVAGFRFRGEARAWAREQERAGRIAKDDWVVCDERDVLELWTPQAREEHRALRSVRP